MTSYIDHKEWSRRADSDGIEVIHSWAEFTRRRILWLYGPERSHAIQSGNDTSTQADLASWRSLGHRSAA